MLGTALLILIMSPAFAQYGINIHATCHHLNLQAIRVFSKRSQTVPPEVTT